MFATDVSPILFILPSFQYPKVGLYFAKSISFSIFHLEFSFLYVRTIVSYKPKASCLDNHLQLLYVNFRKQNGTIHFIFHVLKIDFFCSIFILQKALAFKRATKALFKALFKIMSVDTSIPIFVNNDTDFFLLNSYVRGYHAYMDVWNTIINDSVHCKNGEGNEFNTTPVALTRDDCLKQNVVGHVPIHLSRTFYRF